MKKLWIVMFACIAILTVGMGADEEETSALNNEAQVQKAENLALASQEAAQANLDKETIDLINATGVSKEDIDGMRASGMGWGEIAHELGVHPGVLGLGHTKDKATQRNSKSFSDDTIEASNEAGKGLGFAGKTNSRGKSGTAGSNSGKGHGKK